MGWGAGWQRLEERMRCGFQDVVRTTLLKSSREKPELVCKLPGRGEDADLTR